MSKKLANDYRIWIESSTPGTYNMIKGQQNLAINRSGGTIDTTSKDDFPYATQAAGSRTITIPCTFIPDLPDANGYDRLRSQLNASVATAFNIQIRKGGSAGNSTTDVVFAASVMGTDFSENMDQNSPVSASVTLVVSAAPTTDSLT